ncbi:MAG: GDSL-type esterase/lipase family protein [Bacteroidales bacterium]|nr:GDSL-type esterase/lipase family protein [Bacteroidales bacterium]
MKKVLVSLVAVVFSLLLFAQEPVRVACIGNSITFGASIKNRDKDSYPAVLGQILGKGYDVRNFGISGRTMLNKGDNPYMKEKLYQEALKFNPNIVVIKLGTNDTKPQNWKFKDEFASDMKSMIKDLRALPSNPKIYVCYPAKVYKAVQWGINDSLIKNEVIPIIAKVAKKEHLPVIDLYTALSGMPANFPDKVHPNADGANVLAKTVYKAITGMESDHQIQAFPGYKSVWNGYDKYDFKINGRDAIAVAPKTAAAGNPWIWRPAFFSAFPSVDKALLEKGYYVVYYDLTHLYGSPNAIDLGTKFYDYMVKYYGFSPKVTVEGFSRGGLFAINWAAKNTEKVACVYVDAPVCDVFTWPGKKSTKLWADLLAEWKITEDQIATSKVNSIDNLEPLAKAGISIILVCGDSDKTVPYEQNSAVLNARYKALGGNIQMIVKKGCDHHPHSLEDPTPVVDFILKNQNGPVK